MIGNRTFQALLLLWAWTASAAHSAEAAPIGVRAPVKAAGMNPEQTATVPTGSVERLEYDIRWHFLSLGSASIETMESSGGGTNMTVRRLCVRNHPWARILYRVEDRIESVEKKTAGSRVTCVTKQIREGRFRQDDELVIDSQTGRAKWTDRLTGESVDYEVPKGVHDYVSVLTAIRSQGDMPPGQTNAYRFAMDKGFHDLVISSAATGSIRTASGRVHATKLCAKAKSSNLCVRNVPGAIWVGLEPLTIIAMDVATKIGTVRAVLKKWELDGKVVQWQNTEHAETKGDKNHESNSNSGGVVVADFGNGGAGGGFAGRPHSGRGPDEP